ncbi:hypothetical protein E0H49_20295 [Rhizobium leguminosarum bv. viciae]|nr:hypothetical protein E0H30_27715 [Rhizobium leguminosarum bv. viciae]TBY25291.1 hypothetical protein E0H37_21150 [Rhizobium leguminosarum bv. viciae]TBY98691.1 hypothetical protein E0H49_20295 [Rhizobium leguminosarum bv. viciae]TBZ58807.1 hypothetical protein E0H48_12470 [Rhizobium leguminosarum bv. viciae]
MPFACAQRIRGFAAHPLICLPASSPRWGEAESWHVRLIPLLPSGEKMPVGQMRGLRSVGDELVKRKRKAG